MKPFGTHDATGSTAEHPARAGVPSRAGSSPVWLIAAAVLGAALAWGSSRGDSPFATDSFAYVDVGTSIARGRGITTRVLPLDAADAAARRASGYPPGYPLAIAALAVLGVEPHAAALVIAGGASLVCLALVFLLARRLVPGAEGPTALLVALGYPFVEAANHALSEPLFLVVLLGAILVGTGDRSARFPGRGPRALLAGVLSGLLPAVRYAGAPALAVLGALAAWPALAPRGAPRRRAARGLLGWLLGAALPLVPLVVFLAGAGDLGERPPARQGVLRNLAWSAGHTGKDLVLTLPIVKPSLPVHAPLGAAGLLAGLFVVLSRRRREHVGAEGTAAPDRTLLAFSVAYPLAHVGWISIVRSLMYINTWAWRHLLPAYPFVLVNAVLLATLVARRGARETAAPEAPAQDEAGARRVAGRLRVPAVRAVIGVLLAAYAIGNLQKVLEDRRHPEPPLDLGAVPAWILENTRPGDTLVATEPEVLADAVPDRRFVSLVRWPHRVRDLAPSDLPRLRDTLAVRWVVLLTARSGLLLSGGYGEFLRSVVRNGGGGGLAFAEEVPGALVFEVEGARRAP